MNHRLGLLHCNSSVLRGRLHAERVQRTEGQIASSNVLLRFPTQRESEKNEAIGTQPHHDPSIAARPYELSLAPRFRCLSWLPLRFSGTHSEPYFEYARAAVERAFVSVFSCVRQMNGSNDRTDARAAMPALHKVLVTGIIKASPAANVKTDTEMVNDGCQPKPVKLLQFHSGADGAGEEPDSQKFSPHLTRLRNSGKCTL